MGGYFTAFSVCCVNTHTHSVMYVWMDVHSLIVSFSMGYIPRKGKIMPVILGRLWWKVILLIKGPNFNIFTAMPTDIIYS